jgi:two-component system cell cycle response regulator
MSGVSEMKILIADDELISRRKLQALLAMWGHEVVSAEDGNAAFELLKAPDAPRIGLLDWEMPGQNGVDVCRAIRRDRPEPYTYMLLLTAKDAKENIVEGLESGADDYLIKPWDPDELKARLRTGQRILQLEDRLVEARETMRFKATHDHLTFLLNRGAIVDLLERELVRTLREKGCTIIILGDLDHFKSINDTYGHLVGDEVLREVARRLLGSVRSYDFVGRYGGEEFLLVLNNCDTSQAIMRAEEVRMAVARLPIQTARGPLAVTMSMGVLSSRDWNQHTPAEILCEVDAALYRAKASGRNRSEFARPNAQRETPLVPLK